MSVIMQSSERAWYPGAPFSGLLKIPKKTMNMDDYEQESEQLTPHATGNAEPQKWTPETVRVIIIGAVAPEQEWKYIADAHNADIERAMAKAHQDGWHEGRSYESKFGLRTLKPAASESWQEIARAAAEQISKECAWYRSDIKYHDQLQPFILAAIERSHAAQPQRSQQAQDWTDDHVRDLIQFGGASAVADDHNVEVTAERQRTREERAVSSEYRQQLLFALLKK